MPRLELLKFRKSQRLTQKEMADKLGISVMHYSRIETGNSNPSYELLERAKVIFQVEDIFKLFEKC